MPTSAQVIASRLYEAGCRTAFGIPGGEVLAIMEALKEAGIRVVLTRHENCAGFMAEGVHHHDGAPAILVATIGPGLANAANVIANATQDRVPLITLTGCAPAIERETYTHQIFDHVRMAEPITKGAFRVEPGTAGLVADKALALCREGRPGAVLIDVPIDVQTSEVEKDFPRRQPAQPMAPEDGVALKEARFWLSEAERPIVIAGIDALNQGKGAAVRSFCEGLGIPLITSYKAKGILPEDHALSVGGAGLSPKCDKVLLPLVQQSDCVILAGYDPIEMRIGWRNPWAEEARVIEFSAAANDHFMHQAALNFFGDVGAGLEALKTKPKAVWEGGEIAKAKAALTEGHGLSESWGPAAVADVLRQVLPRDGIITTDSGAHRILLSQALDIYRERGLLQSSALCTMGCAVPLAAGRKLADPDCSVVATVGDAGLEMFLGELATIRDLELSVPIIVFVDTQLALIELKQRGMQLPNLAVEFGGSDFVAIAKALGGEGVLCRDRETLAKGLKEAFDRKTFTLLACDIGKRAYDGRI